jgi:hypothetical protein
VSLARNETTFTLSVQALAFVRSVSSGAHKSRIAIGSGGEVVGIARVKGLIRVLVGCEFGAERDDGGQDRRSRGVV